MPSNAVGVRTQLLRIAESTWGTTPGTPNMTKTRYTTADLGANVDFIESKEIRSDRLTSDLRQGVLSGKGSIDAELISGAYDDLLAAMMGSAWQSNAIAMTAANVAVDGTLLTFTRATGSFLTDGFLAGQLITTTGFTNGGNNGMFVITAVTATVITCANAVGLVTEASTAGRTIVNTNNVLKIGTLIPSFTMEQGYLDIAAYEVMTGVVVDKFSLSAKASQIVTAKFDLLAKAYTTGVSTIATGGTTNAPTYSPMDTFSGSIKEGGSTIATITAIELQLDNSSEVAKTVASKNLSDLRFGRSKITGKISAYFQDFSLITKFINETVSSLDFTLAGIPNNKTLEFTLPRIKYTGQSNPVNKETLLMQDLNFTALVDPLTLTNLLLTRVP